MSSMKKFSATLIVLAMTDLAIGGIIDHFDSYNRGALDGQGSWVLGDLTFHGPPAPSMQVGTVAFSGANGTEGQGTGTGINTAARDLGFSFADGDWASIKTRNSAVIGDQVQFAISTADSIDQDYVSGIPPWYDGNEDAAQMFTESDGVHQYWSVASYTKAGDRRQTNYSTALGGSDAGHWFEMRLTATVGDNGITSVKAEARDLTDGDLEWTTIADAIPLEKRRAWDDGWGTGNTYVNLGVFQSGYHDDLSVIPEPATLTLLVLGGVAALPRRKHERNI